MGAVVVWLSNGPAGSKEVAVMDATQQLIFSGRALFNAAQTTIVETEYVYVRVGGYEASSDSRPYYRFDCERVKV